jgi:hypothetical protein
MGGAGQIRQRVAIETLPYEALLEIFSFYLDQSEREEAWFTLAHVCRRWRCVVIASSCRLNLRLICKRYRPVMEMLDVWPSLPIAISENYLKAFCRGNVDNIVAALERNNQIYKIDFKNVPSSLLETYVAMMQVSFPALTSLELWSRDETVSVPPNSFLGGSAPCLRSLEMNGILFPALPNLLLTTTDLVDLSLWRIPHSGYISPMAMVTCLSSLSRLESLLLGFSSPQSRPDILRRGPHLLTRKILPALTELYFEGVSEYLEDLVARIDTPRLNDVHIIFFNQLNFHIPQFCQFLSRAGQSEALKQANVDFDSSCVEVSLSPSTSRIDEERGLSLQVSCSGLDWQLSSVAQICCSSLFHLSALEHLYIRQTIPSRLQVQVDVENSQWLELLNPFATVTNLYLSEQITPLVVSALQELAGERVAEVLPTLQNIFLRGQPRPVQKAIERFIAARQLFGHPVAVHHIGEEGAGT